MGQRLKGIFGSLKDSAALLSAAGPTVSGAASVAVLRATAHHPSSTPPSIKHLNALLRFGDGARPAAAALVNALLSRLRGTRDAAVALKCLLSVYHVSRHGSFILQDQLLAALSGGGHNPLNLAGFLDRSAAESWALSRIVRWLARVLERLHAFRRNAGFFLNGGGDQEATAERLAELTNAQVLDEMEALVGLVEEIHNGPLMCHVVGNELAAQAAALARENLAAAREAVLLRIKEMEERLSCLRYGEGILLGSLLKRLEDCKRMAAPPEEVEIIELSEGDWRLWEAVAAVKVAVAAAHGEERLRKERVGWSERMENGRSLGISVDTIRFASNRWHTG